MAITTTSAVATNPKTNATVPRRPEAEERHENEVGNVSPTLPRPAQPSLRDGYKLGQGITRDLPGVVARNAVDKDDTARCLELG